MNEDNTGRTGSPAGGAGSMSDRMQVLLSQAAEEQLAEQRQVSVVLADLRRLVTGLGERLEVLEQRVGAVADLLADVGDAAGGVPAVATNLAQVAARVDELAGLREDVVDLGGRVTAVQTGLTQEVRAASAESERRLGTHIDEAVLALAEALLRRRRSTQEVEQG